MDLDQFRAAAWSALLPQAISDRIDARLAMLATVDGTGAPQARGVVIRSVDPARATVDVFTDAATQKCTEIIANPHVAMTLWREDVLLQIRLSGTMEMIEGKQARAAWDGLPDRALPDYGVTPPPATTIPAPDAYRRSPNAARFAILRLTVASMDVVSLHRPCHTRAHYWRANDFAGEWRAP
ncbi:pyridoxamine 5'-phosphate oxidase family protein [Celeribacter arenosi]|uniref:Pyridoxamine 5'-phosphate oxidase Alr4036 family FMN-binding domain-containing protein n=1 Tax=Celeribacter arenosi TaxID=792649 RepID=A0ABP7KB73_9RHOB